MTGAVAFSDLGVLVVEDDDRHRILLVDMLDSLGVADVRQASDGTQALKVLNAFVPDAILADLRMAPMDGLEFVRRVRRLSPPHDPAVPILMMTGFADREVVIAARDAGVTDFVAKPVGLDTLRKRLQMILNDNRDFVRADSYAGPDRRRRDDPAFKGPNRRKRRQTTP